MPDCCTVLKIRFKHRSHFHPSSWSCQRLFQRSLGHLSCSNTIIPSFLLPTSIATKKGSPLRLNVELSQQVSTTPEQEPHGKGSFSVKCESTQRIQYDNTSAVVADPYDDAYTAPPMQSLPPTSAQDAAPPRGRSRSRSPVGRENGYRSPFRRRSPAPVAAPRRPPHAPVVCQQCSVCSYLYSCR